MKTIAAAILITGNLMAGSAMAVNASYEACTDEGPCALRVMDNETGRDVWLLTESSTSVMQIWEGEFWLVSDLEYAEVRAEIPEGQRFMVPAVNPTTHERMEAKTAPKPSGGAAPSITGGGPLVGGSITVNVGDNPCTPCHTGSMREIHKKVLNEGGK